MRADQTKLRQILFNLLSNACKFTRSGAIRLEVRRTFDSGRLDSPINSGSSAPILDSHRPVTPQRSDGGSTLKFRVSDTGIGMAPDQMARLFESFSQAEASTSKKYGGTGLGLAISKRFCQLMAGDLTVESRHGQGTTFTVTLPAEMAGSQDEGERA